MKTAAQARAEVPGISYDQLRSLIEKRIDEAIARGQTQMALFGKDVRGGLVESYIRHGSRAPESIVTKLVGELRAHGYSIERVTGYADFRDARDSTPAHITISWAAA